MKQAFKFTWAIWFLIAVHAVIALAGFFAPYNYESQDRDHPYAPPSKVHFTDCTGKFHLRPFVYATKSDESIRTLSSSRSASPKSSLDIVRCSRCQRSLSIDTTLPAHSSGAVKFAMNSYYCTRCADVVGFVK